MNTPLVINTQKYSVHDGSGIRTTIFFKGCPLRCAWCHNPESQSYEKELTHFGERCVKCYRCVKVCPTHAISMISGRIHLGGRGCIKCGKCQDACLSSAAELVGKEYTVDELIAIVEKDRMFYEESGGGITLSGGEVMSQDMDFILELVYRLYMKGYSVNIDTCGYAPFENFQMIAPYVDTFLYDVKLYDSEQHKKYTGVANKLILDNLKKLSDMGCNIQLRIPVIGGVNDNDKFFEDVMIRLLARRGILPNKGIALLPYHDTGSSKYDRLYRDYDTGMYTPTSQQMEQFKEIFTDGGFTAQIGG